MKKWLTGSQASARGTASYHPSTRKRCAGDPGAVTLRRKKHGRAQARVHAPQAELWGGSGRLVGPIGVDELLAWQGVALIAHRALRADDCGDSFARHRAFVGVLLREHLGECGGPRCARREAGGVECVAEINGGLAIVGVAVGSAEL